MIADNRSGTYETIRSDGCKAADGTAGRNECIGTYRDVVIHTRAWPYDDVIVERRPHINDSASHDHAAVPKARRIRDVSARMDERRCPVTSSVDSVAGPPPHRQAGISDRNCEAAFIRRKVTNYRLKTTKNPRPTIEIIDHPNNVMAAMPYQICNC